MYYARYTPRCTDRFMTYENGNPYNWVALGFNTWEERDAAIDYVWEHDNGRLMPITRRSLTRIIGHNFRVVNGEVMRYSPDTEEYYPFGAVDKPYVGN